MFPSNLQKSIRELDRQISLLETECENMESEKKEISFPYNTCSKLSAKDPAYKPFVTGPCASSSSCGTKGSNFSQSVPKIYTGTCSHFAKLPGESNDGLKKLNEPTSKRAFKFHENHKKFSNSKMDYSLREENHAEPIGSFSGTKQESNPGEKPCDKVIRNDSKRSISSIKEMSETSDDNAGAGKPGKNSDSIPKEEAWVNHADRKVRCGRWRGRKEDSTDEPNELNECSQHELHTKKPSSEKGDRREYSTCSTMDRPASEKRSFERETNSIPRNRIFTKRRSRSVRTKKNITCEVPANVDFSRSLEEKEIQCMIFAEESEKAEFLTDVNNSVKTLQVLIGELKAKSPEERKRKVLNDMQKTLEKISNFKSINAINNPLNALACLKGKLPILENDENVKDLKKILLGVKFYCQELSDEKQAMSQKLSAKNRAIENLKNNEKQYLSLISSLKYNLEKLKEDAEEGARAMKDLKIVKNKLQEEAKVIEALKKSHGKMQDLIENYVLENDKLRAQVKMARLESQKFTVLLSGKEAEIYKYKKEIESFQRQITEQLSLLRSKASENQVVPAIDVIKKHNLFQTEIDSCPSETTFDKDFNEISLPDSKSLESVSTCTRNENKYKEKTLYTAARVQKDPQPESGKRGNDVKELGDSVKDVGFTSCKSDGSVPSELERKCYVRLKRKNLEKSNSIKEMLQDARMNSSKSYWPLTQNSSNTTQCTSISNASENETKESQAAN